MKTIAIFGAGSGLGRSVAKRFGLEQYQVALISRRKAPLTELSAELASQGIAAEGFVADLSDPTAIPGVLSQLKDHYGDIHVMEYAPIAALPFTPAKELSPEAMQNLINLYLLTPMTIIRELIPSMIARRDGAILVGQGASALQGMPFMSGVGVAMAAMRNYLYSLHGELAASGVYVGTLTVSAMIEGSGGHRAFESGELKFDLPADYKIPMVNPELLANELWEMMVRRDRVESVYPPVG